MLLIAGKRVTRPGQAILVLVFHRVVIWQKLQWWELNWRRVVRLGDHRTIILLWMSRDCVYRVSITTTLALFHASARPSVHYINKLKAFLRRTSFHISQTETLFTAVTFTCAIQREILNHLFASRLALPHTQFTIFFILLSYFTWQCTIHEVTNSKFPSEWSSSLQKLPHYLISAKHVSEVSRISAATLMLPYLA